MTWAQTYALRFQAFSLARSGGTYGSGNYGDSTYGQELTDPLTNKDYVAMPRGSSWPSDVGWSFRADDIGVRFEAVLLGIDGLLDLGPLTSAILVLERVSNGPRVVLARALTIDTTDDYVWRAWAAGDLTEPGVYRAQIVVGYSSGRIMTVEPTDGATVVVRAGGSDALV